MAESIEGGTCSCGGEVKVIEDITEEEHVVHGCTNATYCCLTSVKCLKCGTRFLLKHEAPDVW